MKNKFLHKLYHFINPDILYHDVVSTEKITREILWRGIFHDTVDGLEWYKVKSISPGRWAVGYNYLYVLARVLDSVHPRSILETGLGQSSKMIASYVNNTSFVDYYDIVEQNEDWIRFFMKNNDFPQKAQIHRNDIIRTEYEGEPYYYYKDFSCVVKGKKYGLISLDGPWGGTNLSRADIVEHIPDCLEENFVILVDDWERRGEKQMTDRIENALKKANVEYAMGIYSGENDMLLICSKQLEFLTSL